MLATNGISMFMFKKDKRHLVCTGMGPGKGLSFQGMRSLLIHGEYNPLHLRMEVAEPLKSYEQRLPMKGDRHSFTGFPWENKALLGKNSFGWIGSDGKFSWAQPGNDAKASHVNAAFLVGLPPCTLIRNGKSEALLFIESGANSWRDSDWAYVFMPRVWPTKDGE